VKYYRVYERFKLFFIFFKTKDRNSDVKQQNYLANYNGQQRHSVCNAIVL